MHQTKWGIPGVGAWLLACAIAALPLAAHALGLGKLRVLSALNEPLNAEIELTSVTERELKGLTVTLAPADVYQTAGVERLPYLANIKFLIAKRSDGNHVVRLTSEAPLDEPFLHMLLQIEWPGARLVREYTALIDLPTQVPGAPAAVEVPQVAAAAPEPMAMREPQEAAPQAAPEPSVAAAPLPERRPAEPEAAAGEAPAMAEERLFGPTDVQPSAVAISPVTGWPEPAAEPRAEAPTAALEAEPRVAEAAPMPAPRALESWASADQYQVKGGDTLWAISDKVRSDKSLAIEQVILALFRSNPDAFFGKNVNNLRAGKILRIPERDEVESVPLAQARREFRAQYDVWQEYKLKLAGAGRTLTVADTGVAPTQPEPRAAAPAPAPPAKLEKKEPAKPAAKAAEQDELLKIVRADAEGKKAAPDKQVTQTEAPKDAAQRERQALSDRVTTLEESLLSRQLESKELGDKIGVVREQLKREARLLEIEKKDLAPAPKPAETPAPAAPAAKAPEPAKPPVVAEAPKPAPAAEAPAPAAAPPVPAPAAEKPKAAPAKKPVPPPPPAEEKSALSEFVDSVFGGELMPVLLGVVVLAAGAIGIVYLRRRRRSIAEFEESILSAEAVSRESASTTDATGQPVPSGDTSFLSDFSQGGMGNIHTDEVDPIAEAEVYLAYGRDETAEEILKEAAVKNPQREELKVKLLEIYHQRNDVNAFTTLAEELYAQTGGKGGKHWDKVSEMGRKLDPANPMFQGGKPAGGARVAAAAAAPAAAPAMMDTFREFETPASTTTSPTATFAQAAADSETLDFDLSGSAVAEAEAPAPATHADFDLDLGDTQEPSAAPSVDFGATLKMEEPLDFGAAAAAPAATDTGLETLDFGTATQDNVVDFTPSKAAPAPAPFDLDTGEPAAAADLGVPAVAEAAPVEESGLQQWDETATKLDLAKAYIDMGDSEGARSILDEVMAEGNEQQKRQAKDLAAQIG